MSDKSSFCFFLVAKGAGTVKVIVIYIYVFEGSKLSKNIFSKFAHHILNMPTKKLKFFGEDMEEYVDVLKPQVYPISSVVITLIH